MTKCLVGLDTWFKDQAICDSNKKREDFSRSSIEFVFNMPACWEILFDIGFAIFFKVKFSSKNEYMAFVRCSTPCTSIVYKCLMCYLCFLSY